MASKTDYLELVKPDGSDTVDITVINGNMDILDQAAEEAELAVLNEVRLESSGAVNTVTYECNGGTLATLTVPNATDTKNGFMSYADKAKINGVSSGATRTEIAAAITTGTKIGTVTIDGTATDLYYQDTVYKTATTKANGLLSASDKKKLDGITDSADSVSFSQSLTSGTKIGTLTINGKATTLYSTNNTTYSEATLEKAGLIPADDYKKLTKVGTRLSKSGTFNLSYNTWSNTDAIFFSYGTWIITFTCYFTSAQYGTRCIGISNSEITGDSQSAEVFARSGAGGVTSTVQKTRVMHGNSGFNVYFGAWEDAGSCTCNWAVEAVRIA